jgi:hypothetical protein
VGQAPADSYEVFVVLKLYKRAHTDYRSHAVELQAVVDRSLHPQVSLYYRRDTDTALLALPFDPRNVNRQLMGRILQVARHANASVLEAGLLPNDERLRFYRAYLPLYDVRVIGLRSVDHALTALENELGMGSAPPVVEVTRDSRLPKKRLEVRFRRGDAWSLGRLRSLSSNNVIVATGGPPRTGDVVEIEIAVELDELADADGSEPKVVAFEPVRVMLHAAVTQVTQPDKAMGMAGFGARFLIGSPPEREKLARLLAEAQEAARAAEPPPPRREVRYPVRWPIMVARGNRALRAAALDVSRHGMFVASGTQLFAEPRLEITIPLDDRGAPLRASARVARSIPEETARARRLSAGVGLELTGLAGEDEKRFERFVDRVARRGRRWLLVGAAPERLRALLAELTAAGYAASGASDPPALVSKAASARAPDLVIIDGSLSRAGDARAAQAVERALAVRSVPTVQLGQDASPQWVREHVDIELLS